MTKTQVNWAGNSKTKIAEIMPFRYYEELQMAFAWGIQLSDGTRANCIGRTKTKAEFVRRANAGGWTMLNQTN